jgi:hypothetical protein
VKSTIAAEVKKAQARGKDRVKQTGEVFTPMDLCLAMVNSVPEEKLRNKNSVFLDNSCGDGNFLVALVKVLTKYHDRDYVLDNMIYGVDLMPDNIARAKERLELESGRPGWDHIVCTDGLTYDYEFAPSQSQSSMVEEF